LVCVTRRSFSMPGAPPSSTLFPYTTLFRSGGRPPRGDGLIAGREPRDLIVVPTRAFGVASAHDEDMPCNSRSSRSIARPQSLRRSEEHTSELQSLTNLVCRLLLANTEIAH